jgi:hypothetical protein
MKITRVPDSGLARRREPGGTEAKLSENEKITAGLPRHRCAKCEQSGGFGYRDHASTLIWYCDLHRLAQYWADARMTLPSQVSSELPGSAAARLMRAYATQVEVLRRLRNGCQQYVRVEHVHVGDGAQAVIGNVRMRGEGNRSS